MKSKIQLAMKSLNPNSPSPSATMMRFHGGKMAVFGGTFCIQIPCGIDIDCAFNPTTLLHFFRKDRKGVTYTVNEESGRMLVKEGRERVTIPCIPSSEMVIIDVFRKTKPVTKFLKKKALKALLDCVDSSSDVATLQGVLFQNGLAVGTDRRVMLAMISGLPKKIDCVIPFDTIKFLSTLDESPIEVTFDASYVKFVFADGMTVTTQTISSDGFPAYKKIINATDDLTDCVMHKDLLEEIKGLKCEAITVSHSGVSYSDDKAFGEIELKTTDKFAFTVNKDRFELMLSITKNNTIKTGANLIHADGGKFFKMALCTYRTK